MGIELDVLVGHPEHELLFVATQVARAAGLKDPTSSVAKSRYRQRIGQQLKEILSGFETEQWPVFPIVGANRQGLRKDVVILKESEVYDFLIHSRAPQTLPFRKWVTEEVLPTIRKTGQYNAAESSNPIAVGIMDAGVAKTLTMAARSQRPYEDHYHDPAHSTRTTSPPRRSRNRHHPSY
ncbi:BRO-N domain-containing protein [Pseudomonas sp. DC418]|uniref:BRO-N domain-containing protein n=1 Tax=Pseudomonas sp. DC418 TaxID=3418478 RepID=UPI003D26BD54